MMGFHVAFSMWDIPSLIMNFKPELKYVMPPMIKQDSNCHLNSEP